MQFEAFKVIEASRNPDTPTVADVLAEPILVCRASGTCVVPVEFQRFAKKEV
jgi:hypothetical protein